jgi:hypothetical protein
LKRIDLVGCQRELVRWQLAAMLAEQIEHKRQEHKSVFLLAAVREDVEPREGVLVAGRLLAQFT